jgi:hypothetical protein
VLAQVRLDECFPDRVLVEAGFPRSLAVVDDILSNHLDEQPMPAHAVFVLNESGSMGGERLAQLKRALDLMARQIQAIVHDFQRNDMQQLLVHGRFLESTFRQNPFL